MPESWVPCRAGVGENIRYECEGLFHHQGSSGLLQLLKGSLREPASSGPTLLPQVLEFLPPKQQLSPLPEMSWPLLGEEVEDPGRSLSLRQRSPEVDRTYSKDCTSTSLRHRVEASGLGPLKKQSIPGWLRTRDPQTQGSGPAHQGAISPLSGPLVVHRRFGGPERPQGQAHGHLE